MRILFITSTRIGDAVLSTGILNYIGQTYPDSKVTVACGWIPAPLFEGFPHVERVIAMRKKPRSGHWVDLWKECIGTRWDMVVDLRNSAVSRLLWSGQRFTLGAHIDKTKHKVAQAAQIMKLESVPAPKLYFTQAQKEFSADLMPKGETVIGVGPTANWIGKTWPAERFIEIVRWLTAVGGAYEGATVAVFGAPGEEEGAYQVCNALPEDRRIDVIAKGNPAEAAACLNLCDFYIGNDSGLMHCAAAAGVKTFGVFGPSYPHWYAPWGEHTAYARTPETFDELIDFNGYDPKTLDRSLMLSLSVEAVKEKVSDFLKN